MNWCWQFLNDNKSEFVSVVYKNESLFLSLLQNFVFPEKTTHKKSMQIIFNIDMLACVLIYNRVEKNKRVYW